MNKASAANKGICFFLNDLFFEKKKGTCMNHEMKLFIKFIMKKDAIVYM